MNNYYLIAFDSEPKIIELTIDGNKMSATTLQNIDNLTSLYSMNQIKNKLLKVGKISSMDTEILVVHQTIRNKESRIKTFPVLTENDYLIPSNKAFFAVSMRRCASSSIVPTAYVLHASAM